MDKEQEIIKAIKLHALMPTEINKQKKDKAIIVYTQTLVTTKIYTKDDQLDLYAILEYLNQWMIEEKCPIRFVSDNFDYAKSIDITLYKHKYIKNTNINMSDIFYQELEKNLIKLGLPKPSYNNTRSCFCCWLDSQTCAWK